MLAGAGLGDQPRLAHPPGEQGLAEHLVGLVGAAMKQILALQIDPRPLRAEVAAAGERGRPAGIFGEQLGKLGLEGVVLLRRRGRRPRAARARARGSRARRRRHRRRSGRSASAGPPPRAAGRSASKKAWSLRGILAARRRPRRPSRRRARRRRPGPRRAAFGGQGRPRGCRPAEVAPAAQPAPVEGDSGPAASGRRPGVEKGPVGAGARPRAHRGRPPPPPRSRSRRGAGREAPGCRARSSSPWSWTAWRPSARAAEATCISFSLRKMPTSGNRRGLGDRLGLRAA